MSEILSDADLVQLLNECIPEHIERAFPQIRQAVLASHRALQAKLDESERLKQGYYNEASEGWAKYRAAEAKLAAVNGYLVSCPWCQFNPEGNGIIAQSHLVTCGDRLQAKLAAVEADCRWAQEALRRRQNENRAAEAKLAAAEQAKENFRQGVENMRKERTALQREYSKQQKRITALEEALKAIEAAAVGDADKVTCLHRLNYCQQQAQHALKGTP